MLARYRASCPCDGIVGYVRKMVGRNKMDEDDGRLILYELNASDLRETEETSELAILLLKLSDLKKWLISLESQLNLQHDILHDKLKNVKTDIVSTFMSSVHKKDVIIDVIMKIQGIQGELRSLECQLSQPFGPNEVMAYAVSTSYGRDYDRDDVSSDRPRKFLQAKPKRKKGAGGTMESESAKPPVPAKKGKAVKGKSKVSQVPEHVPESVYQPVLEPPSYPAPEPQMAPAPMPPPPPVKEPEQLQQPAPEPPKPPPKPITKQRPKSPPKKPVEQPKPITKKPSPVRDKPKKSKCCRNCKEDDCMCHRLPSDYTLMSESEVDRLGDSMFSSSSGTSLVSRAKPTHHRVVFDKPQNSNQDGDYRDDPEPSSKRPVKELKDAATSYEDFYIGPSGASGSKMVLKPAKLINKEWRYSDDSSLVGKLGSNNHKESQTEETRIGGLRMGGVDQQVTYMNVVYSKTHLKNILPSAFNTEVYSVTETSPKVLCKRELRDGLLVTTTYKLDDDGTVHFSLAYPSVSADGEQDCQEDDSEAVLERFPEMKEIWNDSARMLYKTIRNSYPQ